MLKLFKNFEKKDYLIILVVFVLVIFSVFLDLRIPEYMSEITTLVQTENSTMNEILIAGGHMVLCAVSSLICTIVVGYLIGDNKYNLIYLDIDNNTKLSKIIYNLIGIISNELYITSAIEFNEKESEFNLNFIVLNLQLTTKLLITS